MELADLWAQAHATTRFTAEDITLALYAARLDREAAMYGEAPEAYAASIAEEEARQAVKETPDLSGFALVATVQPGLFAEAITLAQYHAGRAVLARAQLVTARLRRDLGAVDSPAIKTGDGWAALRRQPTTA
jgi:hypothetical protein